VIRRNAPYASRMHLDKALTDPRTQKPRLMNDWFGDPEGLLAALIANNVVSPGKPDESRLLRLLQFDGPMYKVFSPEDVELIKAWISSLEPKIEPIPVAKLPGRAMAELIDKFRPLAVSEPAHGRFKVSGPDPLDNTKLREEEVAWWLQNATTAQFMAGLAQDSRYVVSGKPDESPLITKFLKPSRAMAQQLGQEGVQIVRNWISSGMPQPEPDEDVTLFAVFLDTEFPRAAVESATDRRILGMGAVH